MKTSSFAQLLSLASVATAAMPKCAIDCFQDVIYAHPPMGCKESTMYLCFCKMPSLQWYFVECGKEKCEDSEGAISFGLNLCDELGYPIETDKLTKPPITSEGTITDARPTVTGEDDSKPTTNDAAETTTAEESAAETTEAASTTVASTGATTAAASKTESSAEETETEEAETSAEESTAESTAAGSSAAESTAADATTDASADAATSTPTTEPNGANSVSASGLLVAVGVVAAAFGLF
ncbi:CFEM domain-containing protein [Fusarium keratoplasticum]|uniref:CFEM domain-containing protein n=1 Tax=Fusarium keratoplasticum TaxID=1328300 RepID=A0ACC0QIA5_9HYPO|nr:CFEM domain-containing protein [Fusarium keratoplasticum]KAI8655247.1 CFEM domain-containing protein [Fusarium keratoplasticum]KAI8656079.1 CFEM domain-containing protein [Fusarium keratoplasticum]